MIFRADSYLCGSHSKKYHHYHQMHHHCYSNAPRIPPDHENQRQRITVTVKGAFHVPLGFLVYPCAVLGGGDHDESDEDAEASLQDDGGDDGVDDDWDDD